MRAGGRRGDAGLVRPAEEAERPALTQAAALWCRSRLHKHTPKGAPLTYRAKCFKWSTFLEKYVHSSKHVIQNGSLQHNIFYFEAFAYKLSKCWQGTKQIHLHVFQV